MTESSDSSEQHSQLETAIDLTEAERAQLFWAAIRLLKTRGNVVSPDPNTKYYNEQHEEYIPPPHHEAEILADELGAYALPYDKIFLTDEEATFDNDGPTRIVIEVESMTAGDIPVTDIESVVGVGEKKQYVVLGRDPQLGIVVEGAEGQLQLRPSEDDRNITDDPAGNPIDLRRVPLFMDEVPPLSRQELVELSAALSNIQ
jgi:hypothetical protein